MTASSRLAVTYLMQCCSQFVAVEVSTVVLVLVLERCLFITRRQTNTVRIRQFSHANKLVDSHRGTFWNYYTESTQREPTSIGTHRKAFPESSRAKIWNTVIHEAKNSTAKI